MLNNRSAVSDRSFPDGGPTFPGFLRMTDDSESIITQGCDEELFPFGSLGTR